MLVACCRLPLGMPCCHYSYQLDHVYIFITASVLTVQNNRYTMYNIHIYNIYTSPVVLKITSSKGSVLRKHEGKRRPE